MGLYWFIFITSPTPLHNVYTGLWHTWVKESGMVWRCDYGGSEPDVKIGKDGRGCSPDRWDRPVSADHWTLGLSLGPAIAHLLNQ